MSSLMQIFIKIYKKGTSKNWIHNINSRKKETTRYYRSYSYIRKYVGP